MILDTDHCYYMYMLHQYYDTSHSYFVFMSHRYIHAPLHGYSLHRQHCYICSPHKYTCMCCCYLLVIWITVHTTCLIVPCYRIHVICLFPVTDMDIPVTGHESCWYAICGIPHLLFPFPVILFPVILFPFPVILFYAITRAQVQLTCYRIMYCICSCYLVYLTYQIIKITWGWGRLDGWLGHIGWMYWIHIVCPTAGDGVVLATICYSWAPVIVLAHWDSRYMLQP